MSDIDEARRSWFRREILPLEPQLRAYARRFVRGGSLDVEDLVHETFARLIAYEDWAALSNAAAFATRVLRNIALDQQRRDTTAGVESGARVDPRSIAADQPSPELEVLSRDELRRLGEVVAALPERVRQVFTLRKVYGLSHRAIADRLGLSVSTVEKHLAKGLRICSEALSQEPQAAATRSTASWHRPPHHGVKR